MMVVFGIFISFIMAILYLVERWAYKDILSSLDALIFACFWALLVHIFILEEKIDVIMEHLEIVEEVEG